MSDRNSSPARRTYRHGDLRRALLDAGVALAREGGPGAIVLREATRRAGVVPNAAYRHFQSHQVLLEAVRAVALSELARAIEAEIAAAQRLQDPRQRARAAFCGVGLGYLRFARQEPGLFRTAFAARPFDVHEHALQDGAAHGASGLGACRTWSVESENRPQRAQFLPDLQPHSRAMGQNDGEKWAAAVDLQPTIAKFERLLDWRVFSTA